MTPSEIAKAAHEECRSEYTDHSVAGRPTRHLWFGACEECIERTVTAALARRQDHGCPCLYTTPCDPLCTCVDRYSSTGCQRCCRYGSLEQRQAQAIALARRQDGRGLQRETNT